MPLLRTVETRIEKADTIIYINLLSTCVTRDLTCVLRTARDTKLYSRLVIFPNGALVYIIME